MGLNIKNPRVHELAREAAQRTGRSQTGAIEAALEKFLADLDDSRGQRLADRRARLDAVMDDFRRVRLDIDPEQFERREASDHDWLYDGETGLPK